MLRIRKLHRLFACALDDFDPAMTDVSALIEATSRYGVLLLRGTHLTDSEFLAFVKEMGTLWKFDSPLANSEGEVFRHSNVNAEGRFYGADSREVRMARAATELWHTDSTYSKPGATHSLLLGHVVTCRGGQTQFCDTRVAFDGLDNDLRRHLRTLYAHHSAYTAVVSSGFEEGIPAEATAVRRPLVHMHWPSCREALCLASHIRSIEGLSRGEAQELVDNLIVAATASECVYTHIWEPGDILMWDNRCTMHRAMPYMYDAELRDMRILRLEDSADDIAKIVTLDAELV